MTTNISVSPRRRQEIIDALRRGTVPKDGLDALAVGLEPFIATLDEELNTAGTGGAVFKAVRGEYGSGKTFFSRHLGSRALAQGFAVAEVQISENETPLHRLETVYRRICESLRTPSAAPSALRSVLDSWIYATEEDTEEILDSTATDVEFESAVVSRLEQELRKVSDQTTDFALLLRAYRTAAHTSPDEPKAAALAALLGGQPRVDASVKKYAGVRGDLDHTGALAFLQGLLTLLRGAGHRGLLVVLDEVETLQRVRSDSRDKALNALRQLIDEIDAGRFPGLYLLITGTPAFFDGDSGVARLSPLADRLSTDFSGEARFHNPRAPQIQLQNFTLDRLIELGEKVLNLFAAGSPNAGRLTTTVDEAYLADFARAVAGELGGDVGIAPRQFTRLLIDLLDRVDQFPDFNPRVHFHVKIDHKDLNEVELNAAKRRADDIDLDL